MFLNVSKIASAVARKVNVDVYNSPTAPGLEMGDFYLRQQARDVVLYCFDCGKAQASPKSDRLIARFVSTKRAVCHVELNADFLDMCELIVPSAFGLTMQYRNGFTFFRAVQVADVGGLVDVLAKAYLADGMIRRKK